MRSFIFCTSYIKKRIWPGARWQKWIKYYSRKKELFGAERIFLIDDGTPLQNIELQVNIVDSCKPLPEVLPDGVVMFRFPKHYGRFTDKLFPGWRRSFAFSSEIAKKYSYDKIIHIESDAFVLSHRMARYMKGLTKGWTVFWHPYGHFPEAAIQVICKDSIEKLESLHARGKDFFLQNALPEHVFPFTRVNKRFIGDRYDEIGETPPDHADYVCQDRSTLRRYQLLARIRYGRNS